MTEEDLEDKYLEDGIYDVTGINYVTFDKDDMSAALADENINSFIEKHKDTFVIGDAYQLPCIFFLERKPEKIEVFESGERGFNYGVAAILSGLPEKIMILAEDD